MIQQPQPVVPPQANDRLFRDFSQIIQNSFASLFAAAHEHPVKTSFPTPNDGQPGDAYFIFTGGVYYVAVKFSKTQWVRFGPGTAI